MCFCGAHEPLTVCAIVCIGWRFGAVYGKSGLFPTEYVRPVAAPDFLVLPAERVEPRDRQGRVAASAAIAVAMGSAVAAHELDLSTEVQSRKFFTCAAFSTQQRNTMLICSFHSTSRQKISKSEFHTQSQNNFQISP